MTRRAVRARFSTWPRGGSTLGIELDAARASLARGKGHEVTAGDALSLAWPAADIIVANPPYRHAMAFVVRALSEARGEVAFLLRLNWLGSLKRAAFHREHPSDIYVIPRRPSFTGGKVDATEYAWYVWGPGRGGRWHILV
ncbi:MAG: hypothetical protein M3O50_20120 [Myxococcota bacterium]|nr:hypothetical protein [Myxococcota bacterium]